MTKVTFHKDKEGYWIMVDRDDHRIMYSLRTTGSIGRKILDEVIEEQETTQYRPTEETHE